MCFSVKVFFHMIASPNTDDIWHFRADVINFLCCFYSRVRSHSTANNCNVKLSLFREKNSTGSHSMGSVPPSASQRVCGSNTQFQRAVLCDVTKGIGIDTDPIISHRWVTRHSAKCEIMWWCCIFFLCLSFQTYGRIPTASEFARQCCHKCLFSRGLLSFIFYFKLSNHTRQLDLILGL